MSKQQLLELAERVERLDGPCREVDALIKEAFGHSWDYAADWGPRGSDRPVAYPYTASLDSAMTLVPDTCLVVLKHLWTKEGKREWYATMNTYKNDMWIDSHDALNPLAAIAITAASLRAKAAMIEDE